MSERTFLDTNVLVYADDLDAGRKRDLARELLATAFRGATGVVSTQVLQEYFAAATRKLGVRAEAARRKVELLATLDLVVVQLADVLGAVDLHRLHGISFWDALVVRAAQQAACAVLYTEDLQAGRAFDGLRVVNPFA